MAAWQSGDIEVGGLRLHYTRTGGDRPQVVLAHGFSDDGLCWTPVAEVLASEYDVVMVDARGHGRSDGPEHGYGLAQFAADLAGVITGFGLHRPAVLGHSMGGGTALVLAGTYPELPGAILIEDAGMLNLTAQTPADRERQAQMRNWIIELKRKTREEMIAGARAQSPSWSDAELGPWADAKLRFSLNALNRLGATPLDWQAILRRITCPALLITADPERGAIVTEEGAEAIQALVPQLRIVHISGAGHNGRREQFDRYMDVVRTFLAEVTAHAG
jgi:pimeloyl-ACP methyl ester carboxylesterase